MNILKKKIVNDIERNVNTESAFITHSFELIYASLMLDVKINLFTDKLFIGPEKKITFSFFKSVVETYLNYSLPLSLTSVLLENWRR